MVSKEVDGMLRITDIQNVNLTRVVNHIQVRTIRDVCVDTNRNLFYTQFGVNGRTLTKETVDGNLELSRVQVKSPKCSPFEFLSRGRSFMYHETMSDMVVFAMKDSRCYIDMNDEFQKIVEVSHDAYRYAQPKC